MSDTIAAIATGNVISAIGIIRLSGDDTLAVIDRVFRPSSGKAMSESPNRKLVYGALCDTDGQTLDLCLCTISRGPSSYTGEDTAELQCHGSPTVLRAGLQALFAAGARQALAGEFSKRAFLNHRMDLTQAEAVIDLIHAESAQEAKNAVGQLGGAVLRRAQGVYDTLADIASHYHAVIDYPDEDIEDFELTAYTAALTDSIAQLQRLLDTFARGSVLHSGVPSVILGRPNAGKSSLLNALAGYDRAIVTDVPGTTRDTVEESVLCGGVLLRLIDTAGIRDTEDIVEQLGVERSRQALRTAGLAIVLLDGTAEITQEDLDILALAQNCPRLIVAMSKSDLLPAGHGPVFQTGGNSRRPDAFVTLSSVAPGGLHSLESAVARLYPAGESGDAGSLLTDQRQEEAARRARDAVRRAKGALESGLTPDTVLTDAEEALDALGELTGRTARDEIVSRIFSRFCVGK